MRKILFTVLMCTMLLTMSILAACTSEATSSTSTQTSTSATSTTATSTTSSVVTEAHWWDKFGTPEYGGTITMQQTSMPAGWDPWDFQGAPKYHLETVFIQDWTLDRNTWEYKTGGFTPTEYMVGNLIESWEMPDAQTMILHVRPGIHWQDKAPVNGREFTADDLEYSYDRMLGTGHGYTEKSPWWGMITGFFQKVTATDKYTATMKFTKPTALNLMMAQQSASLNMIVPREWAELGPPPVGGGMGGGPGGPPAGEEESPVEETPPTATTTAGVNPLKDWKNAVGTGPWVLTDFSTDGYSTFVKNQNYWNYDERHPENKLPYADEVKILCIPDISTSIAALRTGKIDILSSLTWVQMETLNNTDPNLQQAKMPGRGWSLDYRNDKEPFTDIRVRQALDMTIDRQAIAKTHYGGTVDGKMCGLISPLVKGFTLPYDDWPQDLKDEYAYNPEGAKALLAEAGYPDGFKTNCIASSSSDMSLLQIVKSYLMDAGVDMEIKAMDQTTWFSYGLAGKHDQMDYAQEEMGQTEPPLTALKFVSSLQINISFVDDPVYNEIILKGEASESWDEIRQLTTEADLYQLRKHWALRIMPTASFTVVQPFVKGWSGEASLNYTRCWVDQALKKTKGF